MRPSTVRAVGRVRAIILETSETEGSDAAHVEAMLAIAVLALEEAGRCMVEGTRAQDLGDDALSYLRRALNIVAKTA